PVLSGVVTFLNADGSAQNAVIQPDGSYSIDGIARGTARIAVVSPDPTKSRTHILDSKTGQKKKEKEHTDTVPETNGWMPLPANFGDPATSGLTCEVNGSNVVHDIVVP